MQHSAVSDLVLHCLHMSHKKDTGPKWPFTVIIPMLEIILHHEESC